LLDLLLMIAGTSGLINSSTVDGSLTNSLRQQLQQAGVLQQLIGVMAALAADLRNEAAAIAGMGWEEQRAVANDLVDSCVLQGPVEVVARLYPCLMALWSSNGQTLAANSCAWLCDSTCRHAEAAMQLCTAALQHTSSMLQHVLPAVQQRVPNHSGGLLKALHDRAAAMMNLGNDLTKPLAQAASNMPPEGSGPSLAQQRQQLLLHLLSRDCLPFVMSLLVLSTLRVPACSQQASRGGQGHVESSAGCSSSSSGRGANICSVSNGRAKGSSTTQRGQQQHGATAAAAAGAVVGSSHRAVGDVTLTPCQLQLFELLGLHPQLTAVS
jgi:hypothetical protein